MHCLGMEDEDVNISASNGVKSSKDALVVDEHPTMDEGLEFVVQNMGAFQTLG